MFTEVAPQEFHPSSTAAAATGGKSKYTNKLADDTFLTFQYCCTLDLTSKACTVAQSDLKLFAPPQEVGVIL